MLPHLASAPNVNHLWAGLLVEELVRQGTTFFVVCPGSRSTPLAVAVGQNPRAEALVHWDERAAAFVALGWGRATGRAAAVVTTSGTAVANLLPAAVEADADGVPLLLITADRPPELRETGANQTVRQPPVFQDVARWSLDWPVPTADVPARWVLSTAAHAAHRATAPPGPVHLNLPFREPLGGEADGTDVAGYLGGVGKWKQGRLPFVFRALPRPDHVGRTDRQREQGVETDLSRVYSLLTVVERGIVVVGDLPVYPSASISWVPHGTGVALDAHTIAEALGWPLLPDVRSGLRVPGGEPDGAFEDERTVPFADLVLGSPAFRKRRRPDAVLHVGGRITSKRLARFLRDAAPSLYVRVSDDPSRVDPDALVTHEVVAPPEVVLSSWELEARARRRHPSPPWIKGWTAASAAVGSVLDKLNGLSEPAVARAVCRMCAVVVAAASMPIRDIEAYASPIGVRIEDGIAPFPVRVVASRGASGIDGTVATAAGFARGRGNVVVALVGDLALLHDQTSLALLRTGPPVVVVVVNNDGGGIFHRLPIAGGAGALDGNTFERFFGTPHGLGFEDAARQVGLAYHRPETMPAFEAALDEAVRSGASALIEVRTDREEQAALRRRIEAEVAAAVDAVGPPWGPLP